MIQDTIFNHLSTEDLLQFGIIPELIGRVSVIAPMQSLSEKNMVQILTEPKNAIVKQYQSLMDMDNIKLEFEPEAVQRLQPLPNLKKLVQEHYDPLLTIMMSYMFELPGSKKRSLKISVSDIN